MTCKTKTLGDLVIHKKGFAFKSKDYVESGVPVIRVSNFTDNSIDKTDIKYVSKEIARLNSSVELKEKDIVIATVGSWANNPNSVVGKTILSPQWATGSLLNQNAVILRCRSNSLVDQLFIYYQMKLKKFQDTIVSKAQGSANQASITLDAIFSCQIYFPEESIRNVVVKILVGIDRQIELLKETNKTLELISQAIFKSWFIDFNPVHAKQQGRECKGIDAKTASLFPDSLESSELGEIPKGWKVGKLSDIVSLRGERVKQSPETKRLPYVPIESISAKNIFLLDSKPGEDANTSLLLFKKGDILFGAMRPYFHKVCIAPFDGVTRSTVFTFSPRQEAIVGFVLFRLFHYETVDYATQHSEGSTIPYAKWNNSLDKMPIIIPTNELMWAYTSIVQPLIEKGNSNNRLITYLTGLRDALLPRLISGQLSIEDYDLVAEGVQ